MTAGEQQKNNVLWTYWITLREYILSVLSVITVSTFPVLFLYLQNVQEIKLTYVLLPLILFIISGVVFLLVFLFISRQIYKAAIITSLFMLAMLNYAIIETVVQKVLPFLRYWHILPICLFILGHIVWFTCKKITKEIAQIITKVICIVFSGLILFNFVFAIPAISEKIAFEVKKKTTENSETTNLDGEIDKPNIYYLLFDEYASFKQIKNSYGHDNSSTAMKLEELGFSISYNSYNESLYTKTVMTNILNLDYIITNDSSRSEAEYERHNNALFRLLSEKNYALVGVGNAKFYGLENTTSSWHAETQSGESFSDVLFQNTAVYPLIRVATTRYMDSILESVSYMLNSENFKDNGQFTMFHIECPHTPFVFDEHGRQIDHENYMNWSTKKYYLGQFKYSTKLMLEIVDTIIERDPNCIIILQSDHGARQGIGGRVEPKSDMHCILNAVYFKGEPVEEIEGLSGVNTMRLVLNRLFETNYDTVEMPEDTYAY